MPNEPLQFLLSSSIDCLVEQLPSDVADFGDTISLDTKHIIAWVKENTRKTFIRDRYDKTRQPKGDPDCKLGCKKRRNQKPALTEAPATPTSEPLPARQVPVSEFYWGYGSGVVATKVEGWGEFVISEFTQPFSASDVSYFLPLMKAAERNLGRAPRFGALDAAFDAFYVHEYFVEAGGFAAVPWADRAEHLKEFSVDGLPLCQAGLAMALKSDFMRRAHCLIPHRCARYACPLLYPEPTDEVCPVEHPNWSKNGCITTLPLSPGAQARHQLDRDSDAYKNLYRQRTATERINSLAVELGIERPKLRNQQATPARAPQRSAGARVTNQNTLIYVLLNLRALQRVRKQRQELLDALHDPDG